MADDEVFGQVPVAQFLDPKAALRRERGGLESFASKLLTRSLSTSTPCLRRSVSALLVEDDSGFAESLADSVCSSANSTCGSNYATRDLSETMLETPFITSQSNRVLDGRQLHYSCSSPSIASNKRPRVQVELYTNDDFKTPAHWVIHDDESVLEHRLSSMINVQSPRLNLEDIDIDEVTDFDSSLNASMLADRFASVLKHFSPREPDRLIGRKMLLEHVDIISELDSRNLNSPCLSAVLNYLDADDLCRMCQVSRQWKNALEKDPMVNKRRQQFIANTRKAYKLGKENSAYKSSHRKTRGLTQSTSRPFKSMQMLGSKKSLTYNSTVHSQHANKRDVYEEAAKSLKNDEMLRPCPKCMYPSRADPVQERALCINDLCMFDFCVKCFLEFHGSHPCVPVAMKKSQTDTASVGSKKSKRNLKRLGR